MSELYDRINSISKEHGLNITSLCKRAGVARSVMSELNMGRTKTITLETAAKFADALGISVDALLGAEHKEETTTQATDADLKFALFGGDEKEITDAMFEEVKTFAQMVKMREQAKKKDGKQ